MWRSSKNDDVIGQRFDGDWDTAEAAVTHKPDSDSFLDRVDHLKYEIEGGRRNGPEAMLPPWLRPEWQQDLEELEELIRASNASVYDKHAKQRPTPDPALVRVCNLPSPDEGRRP